MIWQYWLILRQKMYKILAITALRSPDSFKIWVRRWNCWSLVLRCRWVQRLLNSSAWYRGPRVGYLSFWQFIRVVWVRRLYSCRWRTWGDGGNFFGSCWFIFIFIFAINRIFGRIFLCFWAFRWFRFSFMVGTCWKGRHFTMRCKRRFSRPVGPVFMGGFW